jgi:betaine-homocysteine S-methyltransferase
MNTRKRGLLERLADGAVICAEGYLFEMERRGYLQAGAFVPEVVLDHPEVVAQLHREFLRAGSDVVEAFTYYGHREKLRLIGKEDRLEPLNRNALQIARSVAAEAEGEPPLVAGDICNTNVWDPSDPSSDAVVRSMFDEQVAWAAQAGVDFIIAETFSYCGEARLALESIRQAGLPAVVTFSLHREGLRDGVPLEEAAKRLEQAGAAVIGLNCARGPRTLLPEVERIRRSVSCPVAALPVPYRTTPEQPTFQSLRDPACEVPLPGDRPFPTALDPFTCNRYEIAAFARRAFDLNIRYLGVCCGAGPHHIRSMAEALGRRPPASQYSPDMSKHYALGTDPSLKQHNRDYVNKL